MKTTDIKAGSVYYDRKNGVREVLSIASKPGATPQVTYRLLAAKIEQQFSHANQKMVSLVGTTPTCDLTSFAQWAKTIVPIERLTELLGDLTAKKLRLPPGEAAFMASVAKEFEGADFTPKTGASVSFNFNETRSARGVEKKGLATVALAVTSGAGGELTLTQLGASWIRAHVAQAGVV